MHVLLSRCIPLLSLPKKCLHNWTCSKPVWLCRNAQKCLSSNLSLRLYNNSRDLHHMQTVFFKPLPIIRLYNSLYFSKFPTRFSVTARMCLNQVCKTRYRDIKPDQFSRVWQSSRPVSPDGSLSLIALQRFSFKACNLFMLRSICCNRYKQNIITENHFEQVKLRRLVVRSLAV